MLHWLCFMVLCAVLLYFWRIDRELQRVRGELVLLFAQLEKWGIVKPPRVDKAP